MSHFGDRIKLLRLQEGLTVQAVAEQIGSHKGYVSGIENHKVNPPSIKIVLRFAKLFAQDARRLARLAWVDKAPAILHEDAEKFLEWVQRESLESSDDVRSSLKVPPDPSAQDSASDEASSMRKGSPTSAKRPSPQGDRKC